MRLSNELQTGKAGEYLVCADLILNGYVAYPSEQGLPYDVILDAKKLYRIQVKTTGKPRRIPQRTKDSFAYMFNIKRHGNNNHLKKYDVDEVDIFALVALDSRIIAYLPNGAMRTTVNFRVPSLRGSYWDEIGTQIKSKVMGLKGSGLSCPEIAKKLNLKLSNVYKYSANVSLEQKGTNAGAYLDEFSLDKCMEQICREV
ncbi:MAG: hypothetical protein IPJ03_15980 [Ignavibacteriales bacterium]|nr:hypothetical protein [Ignavibacteriales bacterium]